MTELKDKKVNLEDLKKAKEIIEANLNNVLLERDNTITPTKKVYVKKKNGVSETRCIATREETVNYLKN